MSSVLPGDERIVRLRNRPKDTSSPLAKTAQKPLGKEAIKELSIPAITDEYNNHIGAVNKFDYLTAQNPALRPIRRGGHQELEHWLFQTVLANCYLLALCSDVPESRQVSFRS